MIYTKITGDDVLQKQLKQIFKNFPRDVETAITHTAIVDVETFIKKNPIPVDTGRLRASFHTKRIAKPTHKYQDNDGHFFDGTLKGQVYKDMVLVGSNVEYAERLNRLGGGGTTSRRTSGGIKKPKGYAKGFFDRAIENGEKRLVERIEELINKLGGLP